MKRTSIIETDLDDDSDSSIVVRPKIIKPLPEWNKHFLQTKSDVHVQWNCKYCNYHYKIEMDKWKKNGYSSGNLMRHVRNQHNSRLPNCAVSYGPLDIFRTNSNIDANSASDSQSECSSIEYISRPLKNEQASFRKALEDMVISLALPFSSVENNHFIQFVRICLASSDQSLHMPKADAFKNGIVKRASELKAHLASLSDSCTIHLVIDAWTSTNYYSFMAISCTYVDRLSSM